MSSDRTPTSTVTGFAQRTLGGYSGSYAITCSSPGFSSVTSDTISITSTPITLTMRPAGTYVDARVGKGFSREFDVVLSKRPGNNQVFTVRSLDYGRAYVSSTETPSSAPAQADITFTTITGTKSVWVHGSGTGSATFEVSCATCSLPPQQYVAEIVPVRTDVTELIDNGVLHTQSAALIDQYRVSISIMHADGVQRAQKVSSLFSPLVVPVTLDASTWTIANGSASFTGSSAAVVQSLTFPARQAAGTYLGTVRAGGSGFDPASLASTATVVVKQLKLASDSVVVDNNITSGQVFNLYVLDLADQPTLVSGNVSVAVTGVKVASTSSGSGNTSATLSFSSESSNRFWIRAGSVAAGTYTLTATWTSANAGGVTSLSTPITVY